MNHPEGAGSERADRVDFDRRVRLEFRGTQLSADNWQDVLDPVIARYAKRDIMRFFHSGRHCCAVGPSDNGDAYAIPAIYGRLEEAGYFYAIRLPANSVLRENIAHRLTLPVGRPSQTKITRFYEDFEYQAQSWDEPRRVIAKIEWHPGELFPRVGFIVTNLPMEPDWVVRFYNQRGTKHWARRSHSNSWIASRNHSIQCLYVRSYEKRFTPCRVRKNYYATINFCVPNHRNYS